MSHNLRIISYNLKKHLASSELEDLVDDYDVDALCLQECDSQQLPENFTHLRLANSTKTNRLGLAIYYRPERFALGETEIFSLRKSLHDHVLSPAHERLIGTKLFDRESGQNLLIASFHAAPLTASNSLRRKQITAAHQKLRTLGSSCPTIMAGDYNYPLFQRNLRNHVEQDGYELSLSDRPTYTVTRFFHGHFDFVTSANAQIDTVQTLPRGASDHTPILVDATLPAVTAEAATA